MRQGRRDPEWPRVGDRIDCWRVEAMVPERRLRLWSEMLVPGRTWLEFEVLPAGGGIGREADLAAGIGDVYVRSRGPAVSTTRALTVSITNRSRIPTRTPVFRYEASRIAEPGSGALSGLAGQRQQTSLCRDAHGVCLAESNLEVVEGFAEGHPGALVIARRQLGIGEGGQR